MAPASTSAMRLDTQKAKEWDRFSSQSHGFNRSHIARKLKTHVVTNSYTIKTDSDEENLYTVYSVFKNYM